MDLIPRLTNELVSALEHEALKLPQVDVETFHVMSGGMYARTICIKAGTTLTGAIHKTDHINIMSGDISVSTDSGVVRLIGWHVMATKKGAKRVGYAHADTMWTTICASDLTDIQALEEALVENADQLQTRRQLLATQQRMALEG